MPAPVSVSVPAIPPARRSRWAALGAAVAVAIGSGGLMTTSASVGSGERDVFVPITPCRVMDTRPAPDNVGTRSTPLGPNDTYTVSVRGTNGACTIPNDASALVMNVAVIAPTAASFLTVFPSDQTRPLAANANWTAGQPPLSNSVTVDVSADGHVSFYNLAGNVHLAADIVGYYADHNHDDAYYTKTQLVTTDNQIGVLKRMTTRQVATLRWDQDPARGATITLAAGVLGVTFDGTNIWVGNFTTDTVAKIDPVSGAVLTTVAVGHQPAHLAFDGSFVWVANSGANTLSKINPATNAVVDTVTVAATPWGLAFDGTSLWVSNFGAAKVTRLNPTTDTVITTVDVGTNPGGIAFDGSNIWVANFAVASLMKIDRSTNTVAQTVTSLSFPNEIAFDGKLLWVTLEGTDDLARIIPATGAVMAPNIALPATADPNGLAYDGSNMWVANRTTNSISKVNVTTGAVNTVALTTGEPRHVVFDGSNIWVTLKTDGKVLKLVP
jgi:YVTN family beta-propeller protein